MHEARCVTVEDRRYPITDAANADGTGGINVTMSAADNNEDPSGQMVGTISRLRSRALAISKFG
jgi:hypothetical protein